VERKIPSILGCGGGRGIAIRAAGEKVVVHTAWPVAPGLGKCCVAAQGICLPVHTAWARADAAVQILGRRRRIFLQNLTFHETNASSHLSVKLFSCLTSKVSVSGDGADVVQLGANILSALVRFRSSAPARLAPTPLRQLDGMAPSCTTSAPFVLAPILGVRFGNSFVEGSDEALVLPKGQISQKIRHRRGEETRRDASARLERQEAAEKEAALSFSFSNYLHPIKKAYKVF
jgi:hypothetical protein